MSFEVPDYDDVRAFGEAAAEGWHTASLAEMVSKPSKAGNPMLTATIVIDSGDDVGSKIKNYFIVGGDGDGKKYGWAKLKKMAEAAGFVWESCKNPEELAKQFVDQEAALRFDVLVGHVFTIKDGSTYKNGVKREEYERWASQGGEGNVKAEISNFKPVSGDPDIVIEPGSGPDDEGIPGSDSLPGDTTQYVDDDDKADLPF